MIITQQSSTALSDLNDIHDENNVLKDKREN